MAVAVREVRASYAFVERNFNLVKRYWGWEVVFLVYSIVNSLAVTYIGAGMQQISGQTIDTGFLILYLLIGTLVWSYLSVVFDAISDMITWERWEGTIEYTFMAPVHRITHMIGTVLFAVLYGIIRTAAILFVVSLFFHIDLSHANFLSATFVLLIGSISFVGLGIVTAVLPLMFTERGAQMTRIVEAALLLVSGVYYPIQVLPGWLQAIGRVSPATYVLDGMRKSLMNDATLLALAPTLVPLLVIGAASIPIGMTIFNSAERAAKRNGSLKRNG
ncbi:MAG TPA: ABC transporter permease [Chloroflexota bacterium]|nr:ABC transporter permease [Chloroflexota bacterium]